MGEKKRKKRKTAAGRGNCCRSAANLIVTVEAERKEEGRNPQRWKTLEKRKGRERRRCLPRGIEKKKDATPVLIREEKGKSHPFGKKGRGGTLLLHQLQRKEKKSHDERNQMGSSPKLFPLFAKEEEGRERTYFEGRLHRDREKRKKERGQGTVLPSERMRGKGRGRYHCDRKGGKTHPGQKQGRNETLKRAPHRAWSGRGGGRGGEKEKTRRLLCKRQQKKEGGKKILSRSKRGQEKKKEKRFGLVDLGLEPIFRYVRGMGVVEIRRAAGGGGHRGGRKK